MIMRMKVKKRDGSIVNFDLNKIFSAVVAAYKDVYSDIKKDKEYEITQIVSNALHTICMLENEKTIHVETIQNIVEKEISQYNFPVAKSYITYRYKHNLIRNDYDELISVISEKLNAKAVENQNANVDEKSFGGRMGSMASSVAKHYALNYIMSPIAKKNHEENMIYTHDLDNYAVGNHNCMSCPIDDLLKNGFNTRQCDVRPARSINTAFQLLAVIFQIQSLQQFGGVSATHLDWSMMPYVQMSLAKHYKDGLKYIENMPDICVPERLSFNSDFSEHEKAYKYAMDMTIKETYQAVEGMYHNLNTLQSRSGNQLPFSSINYGTCTEPEGRLITKALLDISIKGIGKLYRTSIFPCGIFQCMKGVNRKEGDPNYDLFQLAVKSTAVRLYPNYANCDWSGNEGYDKNDPKTFFSTINKTVA